ILYLKKGRVENPNKQIRIESIRNTLLAAQEKRPRPQRDGKILADWNGLVIAALAQASRAFDNPDYYLTAVTAMRFILDHLRHPGGGLYHRYCDGEAAVVAFADDYAFVIRALIELYETSFDPAWLEEALFLNRYLAQHFSDTRESGFFTIPDDGEILLVRKKEIYDGAIPSSNSVMLGNLVLLGHLTGDPEYELQASRLAEHFAGIVCRSPSLFSTYLCGLDHLLGPVTDIVVTGEESDPVAQEMIRIIRSRYLPSATVHFLRSSQEDSAIGSLAPFTRTMTAQNGKTTAYLCSGRTCSAPVHTPDALRESLGEKKGK
ncbi:MAG: thioredoxin domain-containing protein, partial [Methanoregula sp.]|nr:thioredoxin domain-containing protein [Methanoregula sp.]